jgi:hypothetical protein
MQIVPHPDAPDPAGTEYESQLFQFIRCSCLAMGRELQRIGQDLLLDLRGNSIADSGCPTGFLQKTFKAFFLYGSLDVVVVLSADSELATGIADIAESCS